MNILEYLKKLEKAGFQAYIVGGYVRDYILKINSTDIDITTSAKPDNVCKIFGIKQLDNNGCIKIDDGVYHIDITTFRKESSYFKHNPRKVKYINNLNKDLKRRDFTINALCMNSKGEIIDLLNGKEDLENRIIRVIGSTKKKFKEDPLRMIRALRIMITHGFKIERRAFKFIIKNKDLMSNVSFTRKKEELDRILISDNVIQGLNLLKNFNLLDSLNITYNQNLVETRDILSMWAQLETLGNFPFTRNEMIIIENIKKILKKGNIDELDLYEYGYDTVYKASLIMRASKEKIDRVYNKMNIHNGDKLAINGHEINNIVSCDVKKIKMIKEDLIYQLLRGNLSNDKDALAQYVKQFWK